jgi:uncharacterized protein YqjF (DUF2071 family)
MPVPTEAARLAERERPPENPVMYQRWRDLLFLHWAWEARELQRTLPPGLTIDTFQGRAWLGLVPFAMHSVRPRFCPPVPGLSNFFELNVRTYVHDAQGRPGVWFYSLDANQWLAVAVARTLFHLPYRHAAIAVRPGTAPEIDYRIRRRGAAATSRFLYCMPEASSLAESAPGTLEFFLVERYRLFARHPHSGLLLTGRVWHEPYRIGAPAVSAWDDGPLRLEGFDAQGRAPDHICAAPGPDVSVFPLEPVAAPEAILADPDEALAPGALPA